MIDPQTLKEAVTLAAIIFPTIVKVIDGRIKEYRTNKEKNENQKEKSTIISDWDIVKERLEEFDEVIHLPDGHELPEELVKIINERNYYKLLSEHYCEMLNKEKGLPEGHGSIKEVLRVIKESDTIHYRRDSGVHSSELASNTTRDTGRHEKPVVQQSPSDQGDTDSDDFSDNDVL